MNYKLERGPWRLLGPLGYSNFLTKPNRIKLAYYHTPPWPVIPLYSTRIAKPCVLNGSYLSTVLVRSISTSIEIENTPNPNAKMFYPLGYKLLPEGAPESVSFDKRSNMDQRKPTSKLADTLLEIEGVYSVLLCRDFLTIVKDRSAKWSYLEAQIQKILNKFAITGLLPSFQLPQIKQDIGSEVGFKGISIDKDDPELEEIVEAIQVLIDTRARPMVMEDGGDLEFIRFDEVEGIVWIYMKGSCEGCPSSTLTLQQGLATMLRYFVPEVKEVLQCDENGDPLVQND